MTDNNISGTSGEYFVAGELSKKGYIALLTTRNTTGIDIIVTNPTTYKSTNIQVKTTRRNPPWLLSKKDEKSHGNKLFYVFVNMMDSKQEYYIVPSNVVANRIKKHHQKWLEGKSTRKDTSMRKFTMSDSEKKKYQNNWYSLGI